MPPKFLYKGDINGRVTSGAEVMKIALKYNLCVQHIWKCTVCDEEEEKGRAPNNGERFCHTNLHGGVVFRARDTLKVVWH
eukprot:m.319527 g.319527  ORF g.319527 m.319527 type:complete len:80 (+) comp23204_c0_seq1:314-553(+)